MVEFSMERRDDLPLPDTIRQEFLSWYHKCSEKQENNKKRKAPCPTEAHKYAVHSVYNTPENS